MVNNLITHTITAQANALRVLANSSMPKDKQDEVIFTLSNLIGLTLNITQQAFELSDDESMSLLTLAMIKSIEVVDG